MSTILENSIWPNPDPEGPLGIIKVPIPDGINTFWPDGDALIGNVVYKDGLISGFVDTKALILNDSETTVIPYEYVDITLDHTMKDNLTITKGERCKYLNIKYSSLPEGFIELDYLESSGTQYIDTGIATDGTCTIGIKVTPTDKRFQTWCGRLGTDWEINDDTPAEYGDSIIYRYGEAETDRKIFVRMRRRYMMAASEYPDYDLMGTANIVWTESTEYLTYNGSTAQMIKHNNQAKNANNISDKTHWLFRFNSNKESGFGGDGCIIHNFRIYNNSGRIVLYLIPVLNMDREAGMYDKISKTFFPNLGTGTFGYRIKNTGEVVAPVKLDTQTTLMSLRDPYYVAPSGVYARKVNENEIEILADTEETTGEGWEHFANTAEAYDYFGIIPEGIKYHD